jgi:ABC-type multidrug transport system fused ATPase/permease subunit
MGSAEKLWRLLTPDQRRGAVALLALMLLGTFLEMLGVGLIIPVLAFMSQSGPLAQSQAAAIFSGLAQLTRAQMLAVAVVILLLTYAFKALFLAFVTWRQSRFVFRLQISLSRRLFEAYLSQPYTFHLQHNSAQLVGNVVTETSQLSHVATIPGLTLISEGLVLAGICSLLFLVEPLGALVAVLTISLAGLALYRLTRVRLLRWSASRQYHEGMRLQHLQQGLAGVKEVKLLGREVQFLARFVTHDAGVARVQERYLTLQVWPRLWFELLAVAAVAALVLTMLGQGKSIEALIPTLGLFAAAAFRLMPSVSKVLTAIQNLRYARPVIDKLTRELASVQQGVSSADVEPLSFRETLSLENVNYAYPEAPGKALVDVSLRIPHGASVGFVGGSGAGKSTLIDVILGLLAPASGCVRVDGQDVQGNMRGWQSQIGYVPQSIYLTDDTLRANIAFGIPAEAVDETAVWRALRAAQLEEFAAQLTAGLDTALGERGVRISGGQRQRIGIARALYHDPAVLVLDEATSALDAATEQSVMEAVKALHGKKTILIVAHRTSTLEHCDLVVRLARGSVAAVGDATAMLHHGMSASR